MMRLYAKLGQYYLATQKWKEAEAVYQKLANRKPGSEVPQILLGEFYTFLGAGAKALEHFQKAVELNPQSKPARNAVINFYLDNRKWDDAEKKLVSAALEEKSKDLLAQVF